MVFEMVNQKKEEWNRFIVENSGGFLQSYQWGKFQEAFGRKIWRVEIEDNLKALIVKHNLPLRCNYLYCPQGPVLKSGADSDQTAELFLKKIREIAKKEGSIFLKSEPLFETKILENDFIKSSKKIQPSQTIVLDITKPEDDLLKEMSQKTRYNVKLAQRKGVTVKEASSDSELELDIFWNLLEKTAEKDNFHAHPKEYYSKMLGSLSENGLVKLLLAKYQGKTIAAGIFSFFGEIAVYLHGASDYDSRQLMAPYLLQWQAILNAKENGLKYYDFGGVSEEKWPGVTRFKKGFGGKEITHPGAFNLIFREWWYLVYSAARKFL